MNEIPKLYHNAMITISPPSQVEPARPAAQEAKLTNDADRRQRYDRRKRNQKPFIERRVSSDRRAQRFEAKA
ncbi:hypothetical protein GCM10025857_67720 [Alicyclobacillus contaminans]|uniref:BZIP domain-containing protein n=1 Tax=Methylophaga marina TaxID=45495 RepID=A0ABN0THZ7_9GAMM|nr:hypothetical protein [Methylophaga marina]BDZ75183.1 hypothetical protein GCM10025856_29020 [Methylophaga marina]GMA55415.1 hypothetical protein GCM10025857_67720 [Alicyclobacillus contaminans]